MKLSVLLLCLFTLAVSTEARPKKQKKERFPYGTWMRSQEEDQDPNAAWLLYRPDSYAFPPARGRSGVMIKKDGRMALIGPSAVDGRDTSWGKWHQLAGCQLKISVPGSALQSLRWKDAGKGRLFIELK